MGLDWNDEQDRIKEELVTRSRLQVESQYEADQAQFVAAKKAGEEMEGNEEYKNMLSKAQEVAESLYQADDGTRRSYLAELRN